MTCRHSSGIVEESVTSNLGKVGAVGAMLRVPSLQTPDCQGAMHPATESPRHGAVHSGALLRRAAPLERT